MRRYFTFRLKGSSFTKEVGVSCRLAYPGLMRPERLSWLAVERARAALGNVAPSQLELVSWREA